MCERRAAQFAVAFAHLCQIFDRKCTDLLLEAYSEATSNIDPGT